MGDKSVTSPMQLPLSIGLRESATFDNFVAGKDAVVLDVLQRACAGDERFVYVSGAPGSGKSHLLQAACHACSERGGSVYLPLKEADQLDIEMLDGLEVMALVAIDDVDAIAGQVAWETALFHLYNRIRNEGEGALLLTGSTPLNASPIVLPDLKSRLTWGLAFQLTGLSDADKLQAMQRRAYERGFDLPDEVGAYLLRHYHRDMVALFDLLDRLDAVSLIEQRRLTIPFVKEVIGAKFGAK